MAAEAGLREKSQLVMRALPVGWLLRTDDIPVHQTDMMEHYRIAIGKASDIVIRDAQDTAQAIATITRPLYGFKRDLLTFYESLSGLHLA